MGWGRGATYAPGSLDEGFSNVNNPPTHAEKPCEWGTFIIYSHFYFADFPALQTLAFLEK